MADEIQGMTVKVGITDEAFTGGISKINKAMSLLQSEFKASAEGLKGFGDTSQQLNNKSEYLNKALELQQQKVKALQEAYAKSKAETGEFSNSTMSAGTKVNNAVAQLARLQNELKQVDAALKNDGKEVEEEGNAWTKFGDKLKAATGGMGEYIKQGVGLAIGGDIWDKAKEGFSSMITFGSDLQVALNGVQTATGTSTEAMGDMKQVMTDIYNDNFGENFEDIAEAMKTVSQQTGATGDDLKELTENAFTLRDAFGYEVNDSIKAVNALMQQFGIDGNEAFNLIAQGTQQGLNKNGDLIDIVSEYSVQFAKVGLNAEDMFNIMKTGGDSGAFSMDILSDGMKEFALKTIDGSKTTQDAFTQLGFNTDEMASKFGQGGDVAKESFNQVVSALADMKDPLLQNQVGIELFGTKYEDLGAKAITSLANTSKSISSAKDALGSINSIQYNDLGSAFEGIKRNIQTGVLLPISDEVLPRLSDFSNWFVSNIPGIKDKFSDLTQSIMEIGSGIADTVKPIFEGLFNFVSEHGDSTKLIILGIGGAFLTFTTIAGVINGITNAMALWNKALVIQEGLKKMVQVIKEWEVVTKLQTAAQAALNLVMATGTIGLVVIAIAALVAGIVIAYNKCEWFRNGVNAIGEWLKNFFVVTLPQAFNTVITFFQNNWKQLLLFIVNPFAGAFALLYKNNDQFREKMNIFITNVKTAFINGWNSIINFFTTTIPQWINNLAQWFSELPNKIMYGLGSLVGMLATWGVEVWNYFSINVPIWINNVTTFFSQLPINIWNFLADIVTKLGEWGNSVLTYVTTNVPIWINDITTFFSQLPGNIWTWLVNVVTNLGTWGINVVSWISTNVSAWITSIVTFFSQLPGQIWTWLVNCVTNITTWGGNMLTEAKTGMEKVVTGIEDTFKNLYTKMLDIGKNIVLGIKDGIKSTWDGLTGWIGGLCDSFTQGVKDKFEIHSPSHIFRDQIGAMLAQGIGVGFENEMPQINTNMSKTIDGTVKIANLSNLDILRNMDKSYSNNSNNDTVLSAILTKMDRLEKALDITVSLDGQKVGKMVTSTVSSNLAFNSSRKGW